jgi:hypothetical protein
MKRKQLLTVIAAMLAIVLVAADAFAQRGRGGPGGPGFRGGQADPQFVTDRDVFHFLLANGDKIQRDVKNLKDGVETVTESDDPEVAGKIQEHVAAMYVRVEKPSPIHMRDPLFAEIFRNADKIEMKFVETAKGIKATETSKDPHVVQLLQEHAKVVSLFVKNGFAEVHKNHAIPGKPLAADTSTVGVCNECKEGGCCQQKVRCQDEPKPCQQCKQAAASVAVPEDATKK